ncbi:MAG: hypothetical protein HY755_12940 [Nitrospirae bacterium]|nr:hypothetical protein [Nitrospirota bacterium]
MGDQYLFQPLTKEDKITVIVYRSGIALSSVIISALAYMLFSASRFQTDSSISLKINVLLISLYISVGMSVFFIHLYISKFKKMLKRLYYISVAALMILLIIGKGNVLIVFAEKPYSVMLLIPLAGCLGFITAKEAFCFRLMEGYILALVMPLYLFLFSVGAVTLRGASYGLFLTAVMLMFFTFRKIFMPIHYDVGDKSAYT